MSFSLPAGFTITGHTGCLDRNGAKTADNTLASITAAFEAGAAVVEIDVRFLRDGTPVLSHNAISREKEKDAVRLDDAFRLFAAYPALRMNIDLKSLKNLPAIRALADKHGVTERIFFTGVKTFWARRVRHAETGIAYYVNFHVLPKSTTDRAYNTRIIRRCKALGGIGVNFEKSGASLLLTDMCRAAGLLVSVWTVNDEADIRRVAATLPDNITSRNPGLVRSILFNS